jgi:hypothetical protein
MIYESRRYECYPGKVPALQVMMETMALPTFEKHGMQFVGAWDHEISGASVPMRDPPAVSRCAAASRPPAP